MAQRIGEWEERTFFPTDHYGQFILLYQCPFCGCNTGEKLDSCPGCGAKLTRKGVEKMKRKVKYSITTEFEAASDSEAYKTIEKHLNAIFHNGEFEITQLKVETKFNEREED